MAFPNFRHSQAQKEQRLKNLPSGPLRKPRGYVLIGTYDVTTEDMHAICRDKGVVCQFTNYTESSYERHFKCKNKSCTYRMRSIQNASSGALYEKGQHNHGECKKRVNDPATIGANIPPSSATQRQPIAHVMGRRRQQKTVKKWNIRTPFDNFEALVAHLMAHGATPWRQPRYNNGKISRYYRCRRCKYVALSIRSENPSGKCVLFETRKHLHRTGKVPPRHLHLYHEVPDLPRRVPPGTVIVIDSDDEYADGGEANDDVLDSGPTFIDQVDSNFEVKTAAVHCKAPLVDYPDSDDAMEEDASRDDAPVTVHGTDSHVTEETSAVSVPNGATEATVAVSNGRVIEGETAEETKIMTAIDALCKLFQHRAKANANRNPTTEDLQNIVNTGHDLVREAFGQIDPAFEGYEDLKKMIYKVIPDAPKPPRRRKQARPMKVEYHPPHGVLSVWMARLRRLQDAVDQFVDQTRTERHKRNQEPTSSTRL